MTTQRTKKIHPNIRKLREIKNTKKTKNIDPNNLELRMLTCMRRNQACAPDCPLGMGLAEEQREAAFVGGCRLEL